MRRTSTSQTPSTNTTRPAMEPFSHIRLEVYGACLVRVCPTSKPYSSTFTASRFHKTSLNNCSAFMMALWALKETNYPSPRKFQMRRAYPYPILVRVRVFSRIYAYRRKSWWYAYQNRFLCRTTQLSSQSLHWIFINTVGNIEN